MTFRPAYNPRSPAVPWKHFVTRIRRSGMHTDAFFFIISATECQFPHGRTVSRNSREWSRPLRY